MACKSAGVITQLISSVRLPRRVYEVSLNWNQTLIPLTHTIDGRVIELNKFELVGKKMVHTIFAIWCPWR